MNVDYYSAIFKRKSFHLFRNTGNYTLSEPELNEIYEAFSSFERLYPDIRTAIRIVPAEKVKFKRDAEYCILIYSESTANSLMNAGYIGEQLDLFLVSRNIGTLWFGIGKPDMQTYDGLGFVIMMAIKKIKDESLFRRDMFKAKRKPLEEIWSGETLGAAEIARFAPSACNLQPWFTENNEGRLTVYRCMKNGRRGIMPAAKVRYYNKIDIGIFMFILETCLKHEGYSFKAEYFEGGDSGASEKVKTAEYALRKQL